MALDMYGSNISLVARHAALEFITQLQANSLFSLPCFSKAALLLRDRVSKYFIVIAI